MYCSRLTTDTENRYNRYSGLLGSSVRSRLVVAVVSQAQVVMMVGVEEEEQEPLFSAQLPLIY